MYFSFTCFVLCSSLFIYLILYVTWLNVYGYWFTLYLPKQFIDGFKSFKDIYNSFNFFYILFDDIKEDAV